ncbi:hypothetical protein HanPI659440_Chr09g0337601 [Helianthus annuus]|nr:hypothetical protein HanPI659440_Chr09g0337601 [Helianthus annuus]
MKRLIPLLLHIYTHPPIHIHHFTHTLHLLPLENQQSSAGKQTVMAKAFGIYIISITMLGVSVPIPT